ncbi:protein disulfide-isomerase TMX3-like [Eucyclogobius newberryi]|uniref:protein disulfide-isomerase TMX3-like n=1 Tax=Eucyclogobius newberryi TaxID=166745 RepID=UPI003B5BF9D4
MASLVCWMLLGLSGFLRSADGFVEELDDSFMETREKDQIWLIKFYAPWCSFCKELDPVWSEIGSELRSLGSDVQVGKADATVNTVLSREFRVRTYPAIVLLKKEQKYNYMGPKNKDSILDFTHRVSGPSVRVLSSVQLVVHTLKRHKVLFLFIGATSELKSNFSAVAQELIVHTNFYSTNRDHLPKWVSVTLFPAVLVFKDETYIVFSREFDFDLKTWILRERFPTFSRLDSFSLYDMGDSGRLVLVAVLGNSRSEQSLRLKALVQSVSMDTSRSRDFYFGFLEDLDFVSGLLMRDDITVPLLLVLNLTNDSYFLPPRAVDSEQDLVWFLDSVLDGTLQAQGGNSVPQRIRRVVYDIKTSLTPVFREVPLLGALLVAIPSGVILSLLFLCIKARPTFGDDDDQPTTVSRATQRHKHRKSD